MKNFFSHKNSDVDFSEFNSALLIGNTEGDYNKSNGSGKSAIFEAILWCLFNKSRAAMMDDIIRWGEKTCRVELEFTHNNERYLVARTRNRINSTSSVEFCRLSQDSVWENISCSTSGDTNSKIESLIKLDYKTFVNSVYFRQNDISEFAESDPSRKKEILKSIVDISRWDDYEKAARKKVKEINTECKILKGAVSDYDEVSSRLKDVTLAISEAEKNALTLKAHYQSASEQVSSLEEKYLFIKKSLDTDTYDKVIAELKKFAVEKESLESKICSLNKVVEQYRVEKEDLSSTVLSFKEKLGGREIFPIEEGLKESLRSDLVDCKAKKTSSKEVLASLEDLKLSDDECYTCGQKIDNDLRDRLASEHSKKIDFYANQMAEASSLLIKIEERLDQVISRESENIKIQELCSKIESSSYKLSLVSESLERDELSLKAAEDKLGQVNFKIKNSTDILSSIKNEDFQSLRVKLKNLKKRQNDLKTMISDQDKETGRLSERQSVLMQRESKMKLDKQKILKKMKRAALFDKLGKMFGKGGIQTILLDFVIEDLEDTANGILSSICNEPSVIVLETQRVGSDGVSVIETLDLKVRKDGHLQNFKSLSGGEKFRISLALRVALSDISSRYGGSSLEFLLLDEVNSPLDRYGVETLFVNVIKSLEDRYKILVITHDESLKEKFDNVINITKVNGDSELEFIKR